MYHVIAKAKRSAISTVPTVVKNLTKPIYPRYSIPKPPVVYQSKFASPALNQQLRFKGLPERTPIPTVPFIVPHKPKDALDFLVENM